MAHSYRTRQRKGTSDFNSEEGSRRALGRKKDSIGYPEERKNARQHEGKGAFWRARFDGTLGGGQGLLGEETAAVGGLRGFSRTIVEG